MAVVGVIVTRYGHLRPVRVQTGLRFLNRHLLQLELVVIVSDSGRDDDHVPGQATRVQIRGSRARAAGIDLGEETRQQGIAQGQVVVERIDRGADPNGEIAVVHDIAEEGRVQDHLFRELEQHVVVPAKVIDRMRVAAAVLAAVRHSQPTAIAAEVPRRPVSTGLVATEPARVHRDPANRERPNVPGRARDRATPGEVERDWRAGAGAEKSLTMPEAV